MPEDSTALIARRRELAGRKAALSRSRTPDDPEYRTTDRDLAAAKIAAYTKKVLAAAPPLSEEQRNQLVELLWPSRVGA